MMMAAEGPYAVAGFCVTGLSGKDGLKFQR